MTPRFLSNRPSSNERSPDGTPSWNSVDGGSAVSFVAIPLRMRTLVLGILAIVVCAGLGLAVMLIATEVAFGVRSGSRAIVFLGTLVALPAALIFVRVLQRRTANCVIRFDAQRIDVEVGDHSSQVFLRDVDRLTWRQDSDYARVVIRSNVQTISLITGLVRRQTPVLLQLPDLTTHIIGWLNEAGLTQRPSTRNGFTQFTRSIQ